MKTQKLHYQKAYKYVEGVLFRTLKASHPFGRKKSSTYGGMIVFLLLLATSCEDVFEIRLDQTTVSIIIPLDSLVTPVATQTFWWDDTYGATEYRFQIVAPHFDSIYTLVADEFLDTSIYEITLSPGTYQWRVKAINSATETPWAVRTLIIDSTLDLSTQTIVLTSPVQNDTSNILSKTFSWQSIYNAENYLFELWQPTTSGTLVSTQIVSTSTIQANLNDEGAYSWRVKASNALGSTSFSTRNGFADTTRPQSPLLLNPSNNAILTNRYVTFDWVRPSQSGSSITDSLIIAIDTNFLQLYKTYTIKSSTIGDSLISGAYFWQVYSRDKAGNKSKGSLIRKFSVQ